MQETKIVNLSELVEDLDNGLTRFKKDDLGAGSIEKKYNLSPTEMAYIVSHPRLAKYETKVRSFIIVDDLKPVANIEDVEIKEVPEIKEVKEVKQIKTTPVIESKPKYYSQVEAFI